jgi:hypothetical protein
MINEVNMKEPQTESSAADPGNLEVQKKIPLKVWNEGTWT